MMEMPEIRSALEAHAMSWFPREACALLVERPTGPEAILADNEQDRLHAMDPEDPYSFGDVRVGELGQREVGLHGPR